MRKIAYIIISLLLMASYSYGQGEVEANLFSRTDLYGTARAISMGGAFGALGGDLTGVSINPAGIAVYRSSEIATTAVFHQEKMKVGDISNSKNKFNFHNLGFIGYFPTRNETMPVVNFGFSYNKVKSFDREIRAVGENRQASLSDFMAYESKGIDPIELEFFEDDLGPYDPYIHGHSWLSTLGYQGYLINPSGTEGEYKGLDHKKGGITNRLGLSERGSIDVYDFTVGTSINNVLNVGVSLSVTDLFYEIYSENREDLPKPNNNFNLTNFLETDGNGVGVKLGLIYRPIHALRLGLSYHSPTWYKMTDVYSAKLEHQVSDYILSEVEDEIEGGYKGGVVDTRDDERGYFVDDYKFKTPDKWTASAALIMGSNMILSVDYELTNYGSMKYSERSGVITNPGESYDENANLHIKDDYKSSSTLRTGFEYRFTPQFYGRLGYAWMQNPYDKTLVDLGDAVITDARSAFIIEGDTNYFTGGIGYRFSPKFYADFALVYKTQDDDLYSYPNVLDEDRANKAIDAAPYKLTNNSIRALLTVGYRF